MNIRYVYGAIAFICMTSGLALTVYWCTHYSWWGLLWVPGAFFISLGLQFVAALALGDEMRG